MPIPLQRLREAAVQFPRTKLMTLSESRQRVGKRTAFLCHSHHDTQLVEGLLVLLSANGFDVYVDWKDAELPDTPDRETATKIKDRIKTLDWFLFLATPQSTASRWCPWEIGYADSTKPNDSILIIATSDQSGKWYGNEYLNLYRQITPDAAGTLVAMPPSKDRQQPISLRSLY
jgi:hypothetical protein